MRCPASCTRDGLHDEKNARRGAHPRGALEFLAAGCAGRTGAGSVVVN